MKGQILEQHIRRFLANADKEESRISEQNLDRFAERCKEAARKQFNEQRKDEFSLRMSNIGKDLRQLWLEKEYGRKPRDAEVVFKMFYGDLIEAAMLLIMESIPEINVNDVSKKTTIEISGQKINGTLDLKVDEGIFDVKSASRYSFDNKFVSYETLKSQDDFGYIGQLFAYSSGEKTRPQGWIVINKETGAFKVVEIPESAVMHDKAKVLADMSMKVVALKTNTGIPECKGVVKESFNRKITGREHLDSSCTFCDHKDKCHGRVFYCKDKESKAKNAKYKWYTKLLPTDPEMRAEKGTEDYLLG